MKIDVEKIKEKLREDCASRTLFPINEHDVKETIKTLTSLFFEFKDSTRTIDYDFKGTTQHITQYISPLQYNTVIESDENKEFLETIFSMIPYYYIEPTDVIDTTGETILLDTRDLGVNDVPASLQENDFYQTWLRDSWGYVQNSILLDVYNKLQYPFITENQYMNSTLFPNLADDIFNKSNDENSYIGFMNTEEENNSVYEDNYEFKGEEIGCLDYLDDIVNQKILSNYKLIDYTNKQSVLIQKWGDSLFQSGQLNSEEVDTAKTIFKLQDIKNELLRRKFAGSRTLYSLAIASIDRQGSFISTVKVHDLPATIYSTRDTSFNNKRVVKVLRIPGILSQYYSFSDGMGIDILSTYFRKDESIPLNTLVPLFYTSGNQSTAHASEITIGGEFNNEAFYSNRSISAIDIKDYKKTGENCGVTEYRDFFLRDNSNTVNWNSLSGIVSNKNISRKFKTLDEILSPYPRTEKVIDPQTGEISYKETTDYRTLDSTYEVDDKPFRLDLSSSKLDLNTVSGSVADLSIDKLLYHQNSLQEEMGSSYPYVTSAIANGNSISLMDLPWMNYVNNEIKEKSKVQDNTEVGCQINTALDLGNNCNTTDYNFFAISYTNENYLTIPDINDLTEEEESKIYQEWDEENPQKYALIWYCTIKYDDSFEVKKFTRQLISKVTLKLDEKNIEKKYKDSDGILKEEYINYSLVNTGILPLTYQISSQTGYNSTERQIIWSSEIGFTTSLSAFADDEAYFVKEENNYREITEVEREAGPLPSTTYYIYYDDSYHVAHDFNDDTDALGYSKAMFMFSDYDIVANSADRSKSILIDGPKLNPELSSCVVRNNSVLPTKNTKYVFYVIKKTEVKEYRNTDKQTVTTTDETTGEETTTTKTYYKYNSDGTAYIVTKYVEKYYWSNPLRVINLTTDLLNITHLEPDWYGLNYHLNPELNFNLNTASPLRKKKVQGNHLFDDLTTGAKQAGWTNGVIMGPSSYTSLCNLTRVRSLDFACNDKGEFPTEWVKDYSEEHAAKGIYGLFLKRFRPKLGEVKSSESNAEYSSIFGDNRYVDAFDSMFSNIETRTNIKISAPESEGGFARPGDPNTLYIISYTSAWPVVSERGTSKYYAWVITSQESGTGEFQLINFTQRTTSRSDVFTDSLSNLKGIRFVNNTSILGDVKWFKNYFRILPYDTDNTSISSTEAFNNWYWNKDSNGKTICLNVLFDSSSLYTSQDSLYYPKSTLLVEDDNIHLYLEPSTTEGTLDPQYRVVFYIGSDRTNCVESELIKADDLTGFNTRISASAIATNTGVYSLYLCVNNKAYSSLNSISYTMTQSNGIDLFCKYEENSEGKIVENNKTYWQRDCFYGILYDLRLYNRGKYLEDLKLLNIGTIRENFTNSPDNYKIASALYSDLATIKRVDSTTAASEISEVTAIRIFNRSIWDSILIDPYPTSAEEKNISSPQYVTDYNNPAWDTDIYIQSGETYYLKDCIEQDLIDDLEVYNGRSILDNKNYKEVIIKYNNRSITLSDKSYITIVSALLEPISYDNDYLKSSHLSFSMTDGIISQYIEEDPTKEYTNNYIIIPRQQDSDDDSVGYAADIDFNFLVGMDSDLSKWLSKGSNVCLVYNDKMGKATVQLSDNTKFDSSLNNIIVPLVIPKQTYSGIGYGSLDRFYVNNCTLSNSITTFLNASSYYNEIQIPVAKQKLVTEYNQVSNVVYKETVDNYPKYYYDSKTSGIRYKTYYTIQPGLSTSFDSVYTYDKELTIYQKVGSSYEVFSDDSFSRGVQYYKLEGSTYSELVLFEKGGFYYKNVNDTRTPVNTDKLSRFYNYDKGILIEFKLLDFDAKTTYYTRSEHYTEIYSYDSTKTIQYYDTYYKEWINFTDSYFKNGIDYKYSDESKTWNFTSDKNYYKKYQISGVDHYSLSINGSYDVKLTYCTASHIYTAVSEQHPEKGKTYYYDLKGVKTEYVKANDQGIYSGTRFYTDLGYKYYEDILTENTYYYYDEENDVYELTNNHPSYIENNITTFKEWNTSIGLPIYSKTTALKSVYYNKWDAIRVLKEGTYYFTCKYPIQIIPFSDDQLDSSTDLNYTSYYASCRFKVVVKGVEHDYVETNAITGYPVKYYSDYITNTLKKSDHRLSPDDNLSFPHRDIQIDLYVMDCSGIAGEMTESGTVENYQFTWKLLGSNHNEDATITLNKETVENGIILENDIPLFLSKNYTSSFFVAMREKGSTTANPESADDDLIDPIRINLDYNNNEVTSFDKLIDSDMMYNDRTYAKNATGTLISDDIIQSIIPATTGCTVEYFLSQVPSTAEITAVYQKNTYNERIISKSEDDMDNQLLTAGKSYKLVFDFTAKVTEASFTDNYYTSSLLTDDEKVNYTRLVNLIDTATLETSEYLYNTDGQSYKKTTLNVVNRNSGFDTNDSGFIKLSGQSSADGQPYYFGNPYSRSSNQNYLLQIRNTASDSAVRDSRKNINNSYTFPYRVRNVASNHLIPAVITSLGTVQNGAGYYKEISFNETDVTNAQWTFLKDIVTQSINDLRSSSNGVFGEFTAIRPNIVPPGNYSFAKKLSVSTSTHDLYGYFASRRDLPVKNKSILITRKNLYSNNILTNNAFDNSSSWYLGAKVDNTDINLSDRRFIPDDTWGKGKDVYQFKYNGLVDGTLDNTDSPLILQYKTGDLAVKTQYEAAISIKTSRQLKVNVVYTLNGVEVARKELQITGYSQKSGKPSGFIANTWLVYSAETEVTSETTENILSNGMYFEFIMTGSQYVYITKAVIRKCNTTSHYLGLSNALSSSTLSATVTLASHRMVLFKDKENGEYTPIQFNNDILKTKSVSGQTIYRPRSGSYRVGDFISYYTLETYGSNSRVSKLLPPWVRRFHYYQSSGSYSVEINKYAIRYNSLNLREKKEIFNNTSDVFQSNDVLVMESGMSDLSKLYLKIERLPVILDENGTLKAFGMNLIIDEDNPINLSDETFTSLFNCFSPSKYRRGVNYPVAVTNVQLLNNNESATEYSPSYLKRNILYELEYLPIVYSELNNHLSINLLLYKNNINEQG